MNIRYWLLVCRAHGLAFFYTLTAKNKANIVAAAGIITYQQSLTLLCYRHHFSMTMFRLLNDYIDRLSPSEVIDFIQRRVAFSDGARWQALLDRPQALLLVTPHYGPFAIGCLKIIAEHLGDRHIHAFYDPPEKNPTTAIYQSLLSKLGGFTPIFNDSRGVIKALRALKQQHIVSMMPDVYDTDTNSISIPFFNYLTLAKIGTAFLAHRANALIACTYTEVGFNGEITLTLASTFYPAKAATEAQAIRLTTINIFDDMQRQIAKSPAHWIYLSHLGGRLSFSLDCLDHAAATHAACLPLLNQLGLDNQLIADLLTQGE
ncbi:hypothetical protein [Shewanella sp. NIFS-20-20]|uniref:LpxL/LpxP family acyltransferase n=1 Tax=Shewanella sp. NIFS-20-20 TaxID=2853806 RepID=UPI001C44D3C2|nr:hypothetical protein [Shewanella sp. NIFS-20-20]MBV7314303.1 hypothetical protein [Shewanella sp. NIFS-20-20]